MGHTIGIGEARVASDWETRQAWMEVELIDGLELGAPLNSSCDHSNHCLPSYTGWRMFTEDVGLDRLFFGDGRSGGLMSEPPGCAELTEEHLAAFETARDRWLQMPAASRVKVAPGAVDPDGVDWHLRRLDWLCWWTRWALEHCEHPSLANS